MGVSLRLGVFFYHGVGPHYEFFPAMDEVNYYELASGIISKGVYGCWTEGFFTRSTRSPVYPTLLAFVSLFGSKPAFSAVILNFILDVFNIFLVFLLVSELFGRKAGLTAFTLYSFFGPSFSYLFLSTPEILSVSLILLVSLSLLNFKKISLCLSVLITSLLYSILIHTRPVFLLVTPFMAISIFLAYRKENLKKAFSVTFAVMVIVGVFYLPWMIRNYKHHKTFVPVCTVAGWHLFARIDKKQDILSVETLTDHIYSPSRRNYTEGDYFRETLLECRHMFFETPFKILSAGFLRIIYSWSFSGPFYRFFLPKAYVRPIKIFNGTTVFLPDFEGLIYVFVFIFITISIKSLKKMKKVFFDWFIRTRPLLIVLLGYLLVHVIGIPLEQYRFSVEPLIIFLGLGLVFAIFDLDRKNAVEETKFVYLPTFSALIFAIFLILPLFGKTVFATVSYPKALEKHKYLNYEHIREIQWKNRGNIPNAKNVRISGIVKYIRTNYNFEKNSAMASIDKNHAVGKLYVKMNSSDASMGIGDVKVVFNKQSLPQEHDAIIVFGSISTGKYKDIIVHVNKWKKIAKSD
ncbi:MAG: glycosyltransferase family 39 protein [Verrucomicrobiota bacterium]|nr:glycosyltransferase family 39 protein [Verrucomicrobiota bacterium]